jgi:N-acetylmuramoyl-L-alanine amidase
VKTIALDPGHGGEDPGAIGPSGLRECDVTLDLASRIGVCLRNDALVDPLRVVFTRSHQGASLENRALLSNDVEADCFLSIHCNAATTPMARGIEVFTSPGETDADRIATSIFEEMTAAFPDMQKRFDYSDNDPDKEARFFVLIHTLAPAVLVEVAFISNPEEEAMLRDEAFLDQMATAISTGVLRIL